MRQWNLPRRAPDDGPARFGPLRLVAAAAMLLGTVTVGLQGAAAQDETFDYDQDGVTWSVDYDSSVWTESSSDAADLFLTSENGSVGQFLTVPESEDITLDDCLDSVVPAFEGGANASDAETISEGDGDGYTYEERTLTGEAQGTEVTGDTIHVCYDLGSDRVLWGVVLVPEVGGDLVDELDVVYDLFGAVSVDGDPVTVDFGDSGSGGSTPEASDDTEATPQSGGSGDTTTYEAPTLGYTFDYDESYWTSAEDGTTEPGRDAVKLATDDEVVVMYVEGAEGEWADTDECVSVLTEELIDPTGLDETVDPDSGDPIAVSGDDESIAAYTADQGVIYIACYADPDSDLIVGFSAAATGDEDDFFNDALPAIEDVTGSLAFAS